MKKVYLKPEMLVVQLRHNRAQMLLASPPVSKVKTTGLRTGTGDDLIIDGTDNDGDAWGDAM